MSRSSTMLQRSPKASVARLIGQPDRSGIGARISEQQPTGCEGARLDKPEILADTIGLEERIAAAKQDRNEAQPDFVNGLLRKKRRGQIGTAETARVRHFIEQTRRVSGSIYGRRMYEVMRYWDGDEWDQHDSATGHDLQAFAEAWRAMPKWVVSRTLKSVGPNATLATDGLASFAQGLKDELPGEVQVAGPELAHHLGALGLIDEYQLYVRPVVLGQGKPFFKAARPKLEFAACDRIGEDAVRLTYVPVGSG